MIKMPSHFFYVFLVKFERERKRPIKDAFKRQTRKIS